MKRILFHILSAAIILASTGVIRAQSNFSGEAYMQFREGHKNYSATEIIADHPPRTSYYAARQYPANLSLIPWYDSLHHHFQFTAYEQEYLKNNFFMVSERLESMDWASAFIGLYSSDLPLFLSTDFILSTLHNSYDAILQTIEWQFLEPNLKDLLHSMYADVQSLAAKYSSDPRLEEVLKDIDLYVSMALSLAEGSAFLPKLDTPEKFHALMAAVAAEDMVDMTLFTETKLRHLDFSQFTPRGHYNKPIYSEGREITLENYFRAMMWLGRIDFLMTAPPGNPWEAEWTDDELRRMQQGALLLNELLHGSDKFENLARHEELISFMVGPDDNLTPPELKRLTEGALTSPCDLFDSVVYASFREELNSSDDYGQKIMSNFFYVDPDDSDPGKLPVSFKLLGQKFLVDSYVFSEVVYDRIIFEGKKIWRPLPDPLDAMAALGNEDALALLEDEMDTYKYASNMATQKYLIESYDDDFWEQSLYNTWLGALRTLNPPGTSWGLPYFMQTSAWHHEKLNTQLTSWAQLRHDNILYGKQSYTGGTGCSYPYTYVEPYPELYAQLALFAEKAAGFFDRVFADARVESKDRIVNYYEAYGAIMRRLQIIAQKELERQVLSEDEIIFLKTMINGYMASGPSISGWYTDLFFNQEKALWMDFTVADVHTQPTDAGGAPVGNVLHVGNGKINMGVFLAENTCNPGQYMAYAGPVSSFHSEVQPNFKRLTDQEWEAYFMGGQNPERPDWVAPYLLNKEGKPYAAGRELKGSLYTGTGISPDKQARQLDYMILFPNPASDQSSLRFVLNQGGDLRVEVYDASGRLIFHRTHSGLSPAEHQLSLPVEKWQRGLYLVRARIGNQVLVKELVLN